MGAQATPAVWSVQLAQQVPPGSSLRVSYPIDTDSRLVRLRFRLPSGSQGTLQVRPVKTRNLTDYDLITYPSGSQDYLSGDDVVLEYQVDERCNAAQDVVSAVALNTDPTNPHQFWLDLTFQAVV